MSHRRLFVLLFVCALTLGAPFLLQATATGGVATNIFQGYCYYQCNDGTVGSAPVSRPFGGNCLNLCSSACNGPCVPMY